MATSPRTNPETTSSRRSGPTTTLVVAAALTLLGLSVYLNGPGGGSAPDAATPGTTGGGIPGGIARPRGEPRTVQKLRISPERIDLGAVSQCRPMSPVEVVLTNDGTEPVKVVGWIATCSCVEPGLEEGVTIAAGDFIKVPITVHPLGLGGKSQRLDFRLEGNARGGSLRIDYFIESPILPMPVMVVRPDAFDTKVVDLERVDADGNDLYEKFAVKGIEPPVARFVGSNADGHAAIEVDFKAIDALAEATDPRDPMFTWETTAGRRIWRTMELTVATDCALCERLQIRIRNR